MLIHKLRNTLAYVMVPLRLMRHTSFSMFVDFVRDDRKAVNCTSSYSYSKNISIYLDLSHRPTKESDLRYQILP